jgi:arginine:ornithine antiporter/lysine permease
MIVVFNFDTFKAGFYGMTSGGTGIFSWGHCTLHLRHCIAPTKYTCTSACHAIESCFECIEIKYYKFSGRAKSKKDVGTATVIGLVSVLVIYFLMTVLAQGVIPLETLYRPN